MDCLDFLAGIASESVDLAVVDPPYNMSKAEWDRFSSTQAFLDFTFAWLDALVPVLKPDASLYVFNTPYHAAYILAHLVETGLKYQNWITWDKRDGIGGATRRYNRRQETILFFTKSNQHTFNHNDIRIPYESTERIAHARSKGILKNGKRWFPNPNGKLLGDVWHITSERHKTKKGGKTQTQEHATPKPLDMMERIIAASSDEGDLVLDCFAGTGTTAVAALKLGRSFIGCDSEPEYVHMANQRITETLADSPDKPQQPVQ